jgi:hypothetical protein
MARGSRIFVFCLLLLIVGTEALKLRKSHARMHKTHDNLSYKKKVSTNLVFLGIQRPERCVDHPPPSSSEVTETAQLYLNPFVCRRALL